MSAQLPPCPVSLKAIQHYLKTASEHDQRDPVVSYWCRLYALQLGLKIDRKSDEAKLLLTSLMDWLEQQKKVHADNEAITNEVAAQAHLENYALRLFLYADGQDRAANFGKNVVKAFYTAGMLFDVLSTFGELTEEVLQNRKYAKWKAAYIHNCLKNGETPVPGPMSEEGQDGAGYSGEQDTSEVGTDGFDRSAGGSGGFGFVQPTNFTPQPITPTHPPDFPAEPSSYTPYAPPPVTPSSDSGPSNSVTGFGGYSPVPSASGGNNFSHAEGSGVPLKADQITKAQKYCKWAGSALNYDDVPTAIDNLQKALKLLQTGQDS